MTADSTPTGIVYTVTDGSPGQEYPINFPYIAPADVKAYCLPPGASRNERAQLVYGAEYTVAGQVFAVAIVLPVGAILAIYRETPLTQEILWVDGQAIHAPAIMKADDKLTFILQEMSHDVDRAVKISSDEEAAGLTPDGLINAIFTARDEAQTQAQAAAGCRDEACACADRSCMCAADAEQSADAAQRNAEIALGARDVALAQTETVNQLMETELGKINTLVAANREDQQTAIAAARARALYMGSEIVRQKFKEGGLAKVQDWITSKAASDLIMHTQPGMRDVMREMGERLKQTPQGTPATPANTVQPRMPGESPGEYFKRIGAAQ